MFAWGWQVDVRPELNSILRNPLSFSFVLIIDIELTFDINLAPLNSILHVIQISDLDILVKILAAEIVLDALLLGVVGARDLDEGMLHALELPHLVFLV